MDMTPPKVGIVVLNYNGASCLSACLWSLRAQSYASFFVLVVDNHSTDDSFDQAKVQFPEYTYIENERNLGFAAGMNRGIREALAQGAQMVWLLNNDAEVMPECLARLVKIGQEGKSGLLSPIIVDEHNTPWFEKGIISYPRMRATHIASTEVERRTIAYESEYLTGCALLIKNEVVETIGYLDERFFLYYEDADYSLRAKKAGFRLLVVPGATVKHRELSRQSDTKLYYLVLSGLHFFHKHASWWQRVYLGAYVTIRKAKNCLDILLGRQGSRSVRRAYNQFSHDRFTDHFPHFRQLP